MRDVRDVPAVYFGQVRAARLLPVVAAGADLDPCRFRRADRGGVFLDPAGAHPVRATARRHRLRADDLAVRALHPGVRHDACDGRVESLAWRLWPGGDRQGDYRRCFGSDRDPPVAPRSAGLEHSLAVAAATGERSAPR
jgi:hypothetical protein